MLVIVVNIDGHTSSITDNMEKVMMGRFCSCGSQIMQQKFCQHDFIFIAKRVNKINRRFSINEDIPGYRGEIVKFRILFSFKGRFMNFSNHRFIVPIHIIRDVSCGVSLRIQFSRHKKFLISGNKIRHHLVMTSCNIKKPVSSLTGTQIYGLFSGQYQNYCYFHNRCQIKFTLPHQPTRYIQPRQLNSNGCQVNYLYRDCYNKYAICQMNSNQCTFITSPSSLSSSSSSSDIINALPETLKSRLKSEQKFPSSLTPFAFCIAIKNSNSS